MYFIFTENSEIKNTPTLCNYRDKNVQRLTLEEISENRQSHVTPTFRKENRSHLSETGT